MQTVCRAEYKTEELSQDCYHRAHGILTFFGHVPSKLNANKGVKSVTRATVKPSALRGSDDGT